VPISKEAANLRVISLGKSGGWPETAISRFLSFNPECWGRMAWTHDSHGGESACQTFV